MSNSHSFLRPYCTNLYRDNKNKKSTMIMIATASHNDRVALELALVNVGDGAPTEFNTGNKICTLLHLAAAQGEVAMVELLIKHPPFTNVKDQFNRTPAALCCRPRRTWPPRTLLKRVVNPTFSNHTLRGRCTR